MCSLFVFFISVFFRTKVVVLTHSLLLQNCVGQSSCTVTVSPGIFGGDPCPHVMKKLSVEAICTWWFSTLENKLNKDSRIYFFLCNSIQVFGSNTSLHFKITAGIEFGFTKVKLQINTTHQLVEKPIENCCDDCGYVCIYILVFQLVIQRWRKMKSWLMMHIETTPIGVHVLQIGFCLRGSLLLPVKLLLSFLVDSWRKQFSYFFLLM